MRRFDSPLDNIRVASPCPANWDEMYGDDRKRFCGECKLNVYNLSGMTQREAEDLVANWEGRLCVRFYRRADGSVLTKDCPVGWAAVKRKLSRAATAVFSLFAGMFAGVAGWTYFKPVNQRPVLVGESMVALPPPRPVEMIVEGSRADDPVMGKVRADDWDFAETKGEFVVGMKAAPEPPVTKTKARTR